MICVPKDRGSDSDADREELPDDQSNEARGEAGKGGAEESGAEECPNSGPAHARWGRALYVEDRASSPLQTSPRTSPAPALSRSTFPRKALYAEDRKNVVIIFSDIVAFSRIADGAPAPLVMDMLHNLFHRYDLLCEKHGIFKVETVGDGCVMAAGLIDDDEVGRVHASDKANARKALAIAGDMIVEARNVRPPLNRHGERPPFIEIRVGIHQGDITCGVLGKLQPRFQVFGSAVNMAARMEQSGTASQVHVSQDFHDIVDMPESFWCRQETVTVKNLGQIQTWYHDPLLFRK